MATEESGGIVQYVRLLLDEESIKRLREDAAKASKDVGKDIAAGLSDASTLQAQVHGYVLQLRQALETDLKKIQGDVAAGLINQQVAEAQANKVGLAFNKALRQAIAVLPENQRVSLTGLLKANTTDIEVAVREIAGQVRTALDKQVPELLKSAEAVGAGTIAGIEKGINEAPTSGVTSAIREKVKQAQAELRQNLQLITQSKTAGLAETTTLPSVGDVTKLYTAQLEGIFKGAIGADAFKAEAYAFISEIPQLATQLESQAASAGQKAGKQLGKSIGEGLQAGEVDALKASIVDIRREYDEELKSAFNPDDIARVREETKANLKELFNGFNIGKEIRAELYKQSFGGNADNLEARLATILDPLAQGSRQAAQKAVDQVEDVIQKDKVAVEKAAESLVAEVAAGLKGGAPKAEAEVEKAVEPIAEAPAKVVRRKAIKAEKELHNLFSQIAKDLGVTTQRLYKDMGLFTDPMDAFAAVRAELANKRAPVPTTDDMLKAWELKNKRVSDYKASKERTAAKQVIDAVVEGVKEEAPKLEKVVEQVDAGKKLAAELEKAKPLVQEKVKELEQIIATGIRHLASGQVFSGNDLTSTIKSALAAHPGATGKDFQSGFLTSTDRFLTGPEAGSLAREGGRESLSSDLNQSVSDTRFQNYNPKTRRATYPSLESRVNMLAQDVQREVNKALDGVEIKLPDFAKKAQPQVRESAKRTIAEVAATIKAEAPKVETAASAVVGILPTIAAREGKTMEQVVTKWSQMNSEQLKREASRINRELEKIGQLPIGHTKGDTVKQIKDLLGDVKEYVALARERGRRSAVAFQEALAGENLKVNIAREQGVQPKESRVKAVNEPEPEKSPTIVMYPDKTKRILPVPVVDETEKQRAREAGKGISQEIVEGVKEGGVNVVEEMRTKLLNAKAALIRDTRQIWDEVKKGSLSPDEGAKFANQRVESFSGEVKGLLQSIRGHAPEVQQELLKLFEGPLVSPSTITHVEKAAEPVGKAIEDGISSGVKKSASDVEKEVRDRLVKASAKVKSEIDNVLGSIRSGKTDPAVGLQSANRLVQEFNTAVEQLAKNRQLSDKVREELVNLFKLPTVDQSRLASQAEKTGNLAARSILKGVESQKAETRSIFSRLFKKGVDESDAEKDGVSWWRRFTNGVKEGTTLYKIPADQAVSLDRSTEMLLRARAKRQSGGDPVKEEKLLYDWMRRLMLQAKAEGTEFTALGRLLDKFGLNVFNRSKDVQALVKELQRLKIAGASVQLPGQPGGGGMPPLVPPLKGRGGSGVGGGGGGIPFAAITKGALSAARALGIYYGAYQIASFAKDAVKYNMELSQSWYRLSVTLADFGMQLSKVQPQILAMVRANEKLGVKEQDTVEIFGTLMQLTGDYEKSSKAVITVLDLMAARHMTLDQASKLVGRAILGDTQLFSRYGIVLDNTKDIMTQLQERFGGEWEAKSKSRAGILLKLSGYWADIKNAIGDAIVTGAGAGGMFDKMIGSLEGLANWLRRNKELLQAVGFVFSATIMIIELALKLIGGLYEKIKLAAFGVFFSIKAVPDAVRLSVDLMIKLWANGVQKLAQIWDTVFHTNLAKRLDSFMAQLDKDIDKRAEKLRKLNAEFSQKADQIFNGTGDEGPKAPDAKIGHTDKIFSDAEDRAIKTRIRLLSTQANAFQKYPERAAKAEEDLNKLLEDRKKLYDDLSSTDEARAENQSKLLRINEEIVMIEKEQAKLAKLKSGVDAQKTADAELNREIQRLKRIAEEGKVQADRVEALKQLDKIQARLEEKLKNQVKYGQRYWEITDQIRSIEQAREEIANKHDAAFNKEVTDLAKMLENDVNREYATQKLHEMQKKITAEIALQKYLISLGVGDYEKLWHLIEKSQALTQAERTTFQVRSDRVSELEENLKTPELRVNAERELLKLRQQMVAEDAKESTKVEEIAKNKQLIARIDELLTSNTSKRIKDLEQELHQAEKLFRPPEARTHTVTSNVPVKDASGKTVGHRTEEHVVTSSSRRPTGTFDDRQKAAETYKKVIEEINNLLSEEDENGKKNNVTAEERLKLLADLANATRRLHEVEEPSLNLFKDLKDTFKNDLPNMAERAASTMAEAMTNSFMKMGIGAKAIGHTIAGIPKGLAKAMAKELSDMAKSKAKEHIAWAIGETAQGFGALAHLNGASAALHFQSAGEHLLAATAWSALAGAAASAAGGGAGSGTGTDISTDIDKPKDKPANIFIKGGVLDTDNWEQMDALAKAMKEVDGRDVVVRRA